MPDTKTILIVDDSLTMLQQLTVFLEGEGFNVLKAMGAQQGLDIVRQHRLDLLIVDVNMPGMSGLEMIEQVRGIEGYANTPCFVLTTESTKPLMETGKRVGATAWIVKPFKQEIMLRGIRKVLGIEAT